MVPGGNPAGANASGSALGASVTDKLLGLNQRFTESSTSQSGLGSMNDQDSFQTVDVPNTLRVGLLETDSTSTVSAQPEQATDTSRATTTNVNVLNGAITASAVRGVATTTAGGTASSYSSTGSAFKDLVVNGVVMNNVAPNTRVELPGTGYAVLYEETGKTTSPAGTSGGTYVADLTVNMIHVHVVNALGVETAEIIVSQAISHSDFPQTTLCLANPTQSVSGHAFIASEVTDPLVAPLTIGYVAIPATGGASHQHVESVTQPTDGSSVSAGASTSDSTGKVVPGVSHHRDRSADPGRVATRATTPQAPRSATPPFT